METPLKITVNLLNFFKSSTHIPCIYNRSVCLECEPALCNPVHLVQMPPFPFSKWKCHMGWQFQTSLIVQMAVLVKEE